MALKNLSNGEMLVAVERALGELAHTLAHEQYTPIRVTFESMHLDLQALRVERESDDGGLGARARGRWTPSTTAWSGRCSTS